MFFFVYGIGKSSPGKALKSEEEASKEAKRLAGEEPGVTFIILKTEAIAGFKSKEPEKLERWELRDELKDLEIDI